MQDFGRGKPLGDVEMVGDSDKHGTIISFLPDFKVFSSIEYNYEELSQRFREMAYLNKGLHG